MATLKEIALKAGCSPATASRALANDGTVGSALQKRVRKAAAELGYRKNSVAAGRPGRRPVVGVLTPSVTNPVFASSLSAIQNRMQLAGHGVVIAQSNYDPQQEADAVAALLSERPTGLILTLCNPADCAALSLPLPPTVLLNNPAQPGFPACVRVDNFGAAAVLCQHMLGLGHRRILFVSGSFSGSDRARARYEGYVATMRDHGLEPLEALQIPFLDGYAQLDLSEALAAYRPSAIIASNDLLALGVIAALRREGLAVPRDISVAGFDGIALGRLIDPVLTTIEMPDASMGISAAALLLDMVENGAAARELSLDFLLRTGATVVAPQSLPQERVAALRRPGRR